MKKYISRLLTILSLFVAPCYAHSAPSSATAPTVVLISLDGFRWDYIEKYHAKNLAAIAANGVRAKQMRPAYPTKTFPNHLTLITGLYPTHHGIVDNHFCDTKRDQCYHMGDGVRDSTWITGIPLWNLARLNGVISATYFWPESAARINGMTPNYYYPFSQHSDYQQRIDQIISWLNYPPATRPHFITGYFSEVDSMGHQYGPDAPQTAAAVRHVDALIGQLRARLRNEVKQPVNLIVLADHGMSRIDTKQAIKTATLPLNNAQFNVVNNATRLAIYAKKGTTPEQIHAQRTALQQAAAGRYQVLSHRQLRALHYIDSPRVASLIVETKAPRIFVGDKIDSHHAKGMHGYIYNREMGALFVAEGPAFKQGVMLPAFDNVDVYPLIARLLNLPLQQAIDGTIKPLLPALTSANLPH